MIAELEAIALAKAAATLTASWALEGLDTLRPRLEARSKAKKLSRA
jgi:hypothetical protein